MNRLTLAAFVLALSVSAEVAAAQSAKKESLESSYARLCANGQQSEACEVLRSALLEKLSRESSDTAGSASARPTTGGRGAAGTSAVSPRWGFWSRLPGTTWLADNGTLYSYAWGTTGTALNAEVLAANNSYNPEITLAPDGTSLNLRIGTTTYPLAPQADGSFTQALSSTRRTRYTMDGDRMTLADEALRNGTWGPGEAPLITRRRLQPTEVAAHKAAVAGRRQEVEAMIARSWGIVPRLIDEKFLYTSAEYPQYNSAVTFVWVDRGADAYMSWTYLESGKVGGWTRFRRDAASGRIEARNEKGLRGDVTMTAEGRIRITWDPTAESREFGTLVSDYYLSGGTLQSDGYFLKNGSRKHATTTRYATVTGRSNEQLKTALAQQRQAATRQAAQAAPAKKSGGGFLGAVQGAIGGMAGVANAGGGLSEAAVGGAVGAIAGGAGVDAGTISASTASLAGGSTAGASVAAGGAGRTGAGSYPTRPNALNGQAACAMMNESNYRQVGVSGGNDVQLKTMCAQAYEYYVMYKRAIAQGYSEADANRTYNAHAQSARVAIQFYQNNR